MVKFRPILRYISRGILTTAIAALFSAYSVNSTAKNTHPETRAVGSETSSLQTSQDELESLVRNVDARSRTMDQYVDQKGARYRLGGSTKKGIGYSDFIQHTLRKQFDLELPRSTYEQQEIGKSVSRSNLCTGDLVLLRTGSTGRHVGTHIGNNRLVHVSISSGVIISSMNELYRKKCYSGTRRVLSHS